jgi:hypothetical protein
MTDKICVDCKHCVKKTFGSQDVVEYRCFNPKFLIDIVTGERKWRLCDWVRYKGECGWQGKWFEPREASLKSDEYNINPHAGPSFTYGEWRKIHIGGKT